MIKGLIASALLAVAAMSMGQVDPNRVVATVNGEEIKGGEYYHRMENMTGMGKVAQGQFVELPPGFVTIQQLIQERVLLQLAKKKGVYPTDPEIAQELKNRLEDNPKLMEQWTAGGRTREELDYNIRLDLAQFKIRTQGINLTDQEVEKFYADHKSSFTIPKQYKLRIIAVGSTEAKAAVDADLKAGKSFAEVAKARSEDVTKTIGGDYGLTSLDGFKPAYKDVITAARIGSATAWIDEDSIAPDQRHLTYHVRFYVEDILPERLEPMTPSLKRRTRNKMMIDLGMVKNDAAVAKAMYDMMAAMKVSITDKQFAQMYKTYLDDFVQRGKAQSGGN